MSSHILRAYHVYADAHRGLSGELPDDRADRTIALPGGMIEAIK
jgi:hypothetical protein